MLSKLLVMTFCLGLLSGCLVKKSSTKSAAPDPTSDVTGNNNTNNNPNNSNGTPGPDPLEVHAWHLNNTGQSAFAANGGTAGEDINIGQVRAAGVNGSGVLVAVSDNGVQIAHEDLAANILNGASKNYDLAAPHFGDPTPSGDVGHGTMVSGIIAARGDNSLGSLGVAPNASLAGLRYIGAAVTTSIMIDQANGVFDIFNYSYGAYSCIFSPASSFLIQQLKFGSESLRGGLGSLYVKAAGNEYIGLTSDCFPNQEEEDVRFYFGNANLEEDHSYPYQVVVGALNARGTSATYSTPGSSLWLSAPGGDFGVTNPAIVTTDLMGCSLGNSKGSATANDFENGSSDNPNCNYTSTMNGTSSATPITSGVIALMLSANPNLTQRDVKFILASTASKVDPTRGVTGHPVNSNLTGHDYQMGWITNGAGFNFHNWYGFGGVNADAAVAMAQNYNVNLGTMTESTSDSGTLALAVPDNSATGVSHGINIVNGKIIDAIQIELSVDHSFIGDLGVELTSPSMTKSILMNINSGISGNGITNKILLSNAFFGESSAGLWTLKIVDGAAADEGTLTNWKILVYGH
ncbi:MAG: S8 family serine peptidase [Halobacteriovoraceae bacterium]|jgi:hypothetical protein|nr:S8 family serine peptidase [Halobacteriovoraceae bacterium]